MALRKENEQNVHNATWFRVWTDQILHCATVAVSLENIREYKYAEDCRRYRLFMKCLWRFNLSVGKSPTAHDIMRLGIFWLLLVMIRLFLNVAHGQRGRLYSLFFWYLCSMHSASFNLLFHITRIAWLCWYVVFFVFSGYHLGCKVSCSCCSLCCQKGRCRQRPGLKVLQESSCTSSDCWKCRGPDPCIQTWSLGSCQSS